MTKYKVTFYPGADSLYTIKGTSIKDAAIQEDLPINFPCGGMGRCGKCVVKILNRSFPINRADRQFISAVDLKQGWRLACAAKIDRNLDVFIPKSIRIKDYQILTSQDGSKNKSNKDSKNNLGIAVDIGTTTVVGALFDLGLSRELAVSAQPNPQASLGSDIISRIDFAISDKNGLFILRSKIIGCVNNIVNDLIKQTGADKGRIKKVVLVGNPVMQHLFLGADVNGLAHEPFNLTISGLVRSSGCGLEINMAKDGCAVFLPNIKDFVGSDCLAMIIAAGIYKSAKPILAVDLGTNSEVVLGNKDRILVASTAAGPAFEGSHISCGMPAKLGAIESVVLEKDKALVSVIGNVKPIGICGSGLVDIISQLLKTGRLDISGRLRKDFVIYKNKRIIIKVTQKDVRQIQLAKAAVHSAVEILKKVYKLKDKDINKVFMAGAFGNFMNPRSLADIKIISDGLNNKIRFIGNTALAGAKMALLSEKIIDEAVRLSQFAEHVSLNKYKNFQEEFVRAMRF